MPGRLNCKAKHHRPIMICNFFFERCGCSNNHKELLMIFTSLSQLAPIHCPAPPMNAPNSTPLSAATTDFPGETTMPASLQRSSARFCNLISSSQSPSVTLAPPAKLSRYTCHQGLPQREPSALLLTIQLGNTAVLWIWDSALRPPESRTASAISCIIPTAELQPMGSTQQDKYHKSS